MTIPVHIGSSSRQSDTALATIGLGYGLTTKSEIYTRATYSFGHSPFSYVGKTRVKTLSGNSFQSHVIGMNTGFRMR